MCSSFCHQIAGSNGGPCAACCTLLVPRLKDRADRAALRTRAAADGQSMFPGTLIEALGRLELVERLRANASALSAANVQVQVRSAKVARLESKLVWLQGGAEAATEQANGCELISLLQDALRKGEKAVV